MRAGGSLAQPGLLFRAAAAALPVLLNAAPPHQPYLLLRAAKPLVEVLQGAAQLLKALQGVSWAL